MDASRPGEGLTVVVVAGAGARGAYEAAAMAEVLPAICPNGLGNTILLGTSAGAINVALWAARATPGRSLKDVGDEVKDVWRRIRRDEVYTVPGWAIARDLGNAVVDTAVETARDVLEGAFRFLPEAVRPTWVPERDATTAAIASTGALLDTAPLRRSAERLVDFEALHTNVRLRSLGGVGLVATSCPQNASGGRSRVFLHLHGAHAVPTVAEGSALDYVAVARLNVDHILASAAIPVVFPPVRVREPAECAGYYTDGGVRLNAPIEPAIRLGAERVVVISSHATTYPTDDRAAATRAARPGIFDIGAQAVHATLADGMIEDLRQVQRINRMVAEAGSGVLRAEDGRPFRQVDVVEIAPQNGQLSPLAAEVATKLPSAADRALLRFFESFHGGGGRNELVSYLLFEPAYYEKQFKLARDDARKALERLGDRQAR